MDARRIAFEGIDNFRDFGGYPGRGGRLKAGMLYRSGHHGGATDADLQRLAELGLAVIVDLRRANERERMPTRRWEGFSAQVIDNDLGQETLDEWGEFVMGSDLTPVSFRNYMLDYYDKAPFQRRHVDLYSRYFRALADAQGPVLVHCSAGKDRTGILCALTHHVAGVADDDILADYLLTNDMDRLAARLPLIRQAIFDNTGRTAQDDALITALRVEAEYLAGAFAAMRAAHGSVDGYLDQALGMDSGLRDQVRARLLT
jgi:protein tyrosine/serine phosphatase